MAATFLFLIKLPSLTLPVIGPHHVTLPFSSASSIPRLPLTIATHPAYSISFATNALLATLSTANHDESAKQDYLAKLESKIESMDSKFNELLRLLH